MNCVKAAATRLGQALVIGTSIAVLVACGGKGSTLSGGGSTNQIAPPGSNVATVVVNAGPAGNDVNTLFTSVTICVPGSTTSCQTIDDIEIDTGSSGFRVLASALKADTAVQYRSWGIPSAGTSSAWTSPPQRPQYQATASRTGGSALRRTWRFSPRGRSRLGTPAGM